MPERCRFCWVCRAALHTCIDVKVVNKLLRAGAKFNRLDRKGFSPLSIACRDNKLAKAQALLEYRADVNGAAPFANSLTPLMIACSRGHHDIVIMVRRARLRAVGMRCGVRCGWWYSVGAYCPGVALCLYTAYPPQLLKAGADWSRVLSGQKEGLANTALAFAVSEKQGHNGARCTRTRARP